MSQYNNRIAAARNNGFEIYTNTINENGACGTILTNTDTKSPYNGECIDLFEDGSYDHYSQFKNEPLKYKVS